MCSSDLSKMEAYSMGYRNPYRDLAYDDKFNFFHTDNDNEEDLPADADGGIAGKADVVADHDVIDDALQAANHVLDHGGPRQAPDGPPDGPFDDRSIECSRGGLNPAILPRSAIADGVAVPERLFEISATHTEEAFSTRFTSPWASTTAGWRCRASK